MKSLRSIIVAWSVALVVTGSLTAPPAAAQSGERVQDLCLLRDGSIGRCKDACKGVLGRLELSDGEVQLRNCRIDELLQLGPKRDGDMGGVRLADFFVQHRGEVSNDRLDNLALKVLGILAREAIFRVRVQPGPVAGPIFAIPVWKRPNERMLMVVRGDDLVVYYESGAVLPVPAFLRAHIGLANRIDADRIVGVAPESYKNCVGDTLESDLNRRSKYPTISTVGLALAQVLDNDIGVDVGGWLAGGLHQIQATSFETAIHYESIGGFGSYGEPKAIRFSHPSHKSKFLAYLENCGSVTKNANCGDTNRVNDQVVAIADGYERTAELDIFRVACAAWGGEPLDWRNRASRVLSPGPIQAWQLLAVAPTGRPGDPARVLLPRAFARYVEWPIASKPIQKAVEITGTGKINELGNVESGGMTGRDPGQPDFQNPGVAVALGRLIDGNRGAKLAFYLPEQNYDYHRIAARVGDGKLVVIGPGRSGGSIEMRSLDIGDADRCLIDIPDKCISLQARDGQLDLLERLARVVIERPAEGCSDPLSENRACGGVQEQVGGQQEIKSVMVRAPKAGTEFQDCEICPKMIMLPAGRFVMGSPKNEVGRTEHEEPQHEVTIGYQLAVGKYEVTFAEWDACVLEDGCLNVDDLGWGRGQHPVMNVSEDKINQYLEWLSRRTGRQYRLLSEAEWEYAARAGTTTQFHTGTMITKSQANFMSNKTADVGGSQDNGFGLFDIHGNVWELVGDEWTENYKGARSDGSPQWKFGEHGVLRGGSWGSDAQSVRSANRFRMSLYADADIGFRVARAFTSEGPVPVDETALDQAFWKSISASRTPADFEAYLKKYDKGRFAAEALRTLEKLNGGHIPQERTAMATPPASIIQVDGEWPRAGMVFKDCVDCPELVIVPRGSFTMGSPESEPQRDSDEGPQRRVTIGYDLAVGRYEVTFAEWDACVAGGGCGGYRPEDEGWGRGRRPVINVSWNDTRGYMDWLSRKTGQSYRLLSEAEWEYSARGGTTSPFWSGRKITSDQANYDSRDWYDSAYNHGGLDVFRQRTVVVGSFQGNPFGLFNMHGNVWEWVDDCWHDGYEGAPSDGGVWIATCGSSARALRGGSWRNHPRYVRSATRVRRSPGDRDVEIGFRLARTFSR